MKKQPDKSVLADLIERFNNTVTPTALETDFSNVCESQAEKIIKLEDKVQSLNNALNKYKGEQGKPNVRKQTRANKDKDHSSEKDRRGNKTNKTRKPKSSKKNLEVSNTVTLTINPDSLPSDAVPNGSKKTLIQDIKIAANNTLFLRQQYYSPSENKHYTAPLPTGYEGQFGPTIKSWTSFLNTQGGMTLESLETFYKTANIDISKSTIHSFTIKTPTILEPEKVEVVKAGLQSTNYQHLDDTNAREDGKNRYVNVLGNEYYLAYFTLTSKSRLSVIEMLSKDHFGFTLNEAAFNLLATMNLPHKVIESLKVFHSSTILNSKELEVILDKVLGDKKFPKYRKLITDAAAISTYRKSPYAIETLITDDAPQFKLITESLALCWVHEGRHYKKLTPIFKKHQDSVDSFLDRFWDYYHKLIEYKKNPGQDEIDKLSNEFTELFSTITGYEKLDKQIELTLKKKRQLLLVLEKPELPLHNNPAELMARKQAGMRDVHLHTMSEEGTKAKDTMVTITETCKKLAVNVFDYIYDRITKNYSMPSLAELITIRSSQAQ